MRPPMLLQSPPRMLPRRKRWDLQLIFFGRILIDTSFQKEEAKEAKPKSPKVSRRLSARVTDFFKVRTKSETPATAKVEENPPKIEEPAPVAPLENPADGETAAPAKEEPKEEAAPVEEAPKVEAPPAAPVVAAAA